MPRIARVTVPGIPHHVTQRGNRRQPVFFKNGDRQSYLHILSEQSKRYGVAIWAYCLMDNHVHFIAVPEEIDSLARTFGEAHRRYTWNINQREGWTGYLWQGRFASFPLDESYLIATIRYVERNPVEAGLVTRAEDYRWSSAAAHVTKTRDPILGTHYVTQQIRDWRAFLEKRENSIGPEIERHARTDRPLGDQEFLQRLEGLTSRTLFKQKPGPRRT